MDTVILDGARLKAIGHKSPTAIVTVNSLKQRERLRHSSDISRTRSELARQGKKIVETDYMQFWKDLAAVGVGSIRYGRKNKPDQFDWHYSLKEIAKSCLDGSDLVAKKINHAEPIAEIETAKSILRKAVTETKQEIKPKVAVNNADRLVYVALRPDFYVEISVPADFNQKEAEILYKALTRVAF